MYKKSKKGKFLHNSLYEIRFATWTLVQIYLPSPIFSGPDHNILYLKFFSKLVFHITLKPT